MSTGSVIDSQASLENTLDAESQQLNADLAARLNSISAANSNKLGSVPLPPVIPTTGTGYGAINSPAAAPTTQPYNDYGLGKYTGNVLGNIGGSPNVKAAAWFLSLSLTQIVSIVLGMMFIGAGIFFLHPPTTQTVITGAKRGVELLSA